MTFFERNKQGLHIILIFSVLTLGPLPGIYSSYQDEMNKRKEQIMKSQVIKNIKNASNYNEKPGTCITCKFCKEIEGYNSGGIGALHCIRNPDFQFQVVDRATCNKWEPKQ